MNKKKLKNIKLLYYPYRVLKKIINETENYSHYIRSLHYISENKKRVERKLCSGEVVNVVFIIQYIPAWNKLEPIYLKMQADKRFNPVILCVPLNIQNNIYSGENGNDTYAYFKEHNQDVINAINDDGTWYDITKIDPDYVFHSRPYNSFMPKCYTSQVIRKYALICNVLYGLSLTKYVEPVVLNKDYFNDCFCYFALDEKEKEYYDHRFGLGVKLNIQKCLAYGGIGIGQMMLSETSKKENGYKKTIIWTPRWSTDEKIGGSNFFNYKNVMLDLARQHQECLFIFRPHPLMFGNFIKTGEMTEEEVEQFKKLCVGNIRLDETKEYFNTFWQSDLLITDGSAIVPEYFATKKPIMFCQTKISESNTEFYDEIISRCYEIFNKDGLIRYFNQLLEGNDKKEKDRIEFVDKKLVRYKTNSEKIVESLIKWR